MRRTLDFAAIRSHARTGIGAVLWFSKINHHLNPIPLLSSYLDTRSLKKCWNHTKRTHLETDDNTTQAFPLSGFYQLLIAHPQIPSEHPAYYPPRPKKGIVEAALGTNERDSHNDAPTSAQLVFGSNLVGPRRKNDEKAHTMMIAGVRVPPKPQEPDNCCMSGCVNCVWDLFREDLEEWAIANAKAEKAIRLQNTKRPKDGDGVAGANGLGSEEVNDDDIDSEKATIDTSMWKGLEDIPIGIRVFMDTEKLIKSKRKV
ncbi:hypothetical protein TWF694_008670 [Orbilia ellipsospora]|uniref:Oxidoreductase-like domain-containing protein n=1 Tax=Orbilia ellipsospora TaxID=2528407 RepID=A0AAV9XCQ4_9PEZI